MAVYKITPTKSNLIKAKATLKLMHQGYDILDKKRIVLLREMNLIADKTKRLEALFNKKMIEYYGVLDKAVVTVGEGFINDTAQTIPIKNDIEITSTSVMGLTIPKIDYKPKKLKLNYGFFETNATFDKCIIMMDEIMGLIYQLAELKTSSLNLGFEVKKLQKRTNSLDKMQIPKYEAIIKNISDSMEEKEREEFYRTKIIKRISNKVKVVEIQQ